MDRKDPSLPFEALTSLHAGSLLSAIAFPCHLEYPSRNLIAEQDATRHPTLLYPAMGRHLQIPAVAAAEEECYKLEWQEAEEVVVEEQPHLSSL